MKENLAESFEVPLDDKRIDSTWDRVQRKLETRRRMRRRLRVAAGVAVVSAVAGLGLWGWSAAAPDALERGVAEVPAGPSEVIMSDGVRMELSAESRVEPCERYPRQDCVRVSRGRVTFDVEPRQQNPFRVLCGDVEVTVLGTRFTVEQLDTEVGNRTAVRVAEGRVGVSVLGGAHRVLSPGQTWEEQHDGRGDEDLVERRDAGPPSTADSGGAPPRSGHDAASAIQPASVPTLEELRQNARDARRSGNARQEARAYEELLARYPRSPDAGLASFELARLRMDVLGEPQKAIPLLERYANGGGPLAGDALARLAIAYAMVGRSEDCSRAKARYSAAQPNGIHIRRLDRTCK